MKPRLALALALTLALGGLSQAQDFERPGVDRFDHYLVVTPQKLAKGIQPLLAHRRLGMLKATTFLVPHGSLAERREAIRLEVARVKPKYLLLVGDVDQTPTFVVRKCATDRPYGDFDGDGFPEVAGSGSASAP